MSTITSITTFPDFTYQMKPLQHTQEAGKMAWKFNKCKQAVKPELVICLTEWLEKKKKRCKKNIKEA